MRQSSPPSMRRCRRRLVVALVASAALLSACGGSPRHLAGAAPTTTTNTTTAPASSSSTAAPKPASPPAVVAPLTGLPASSATAGQVAVVVKVDNIAAALPQVGVAAADIVYEEMVEGGLTRLAAVFQSHQPTDVGPVRSGRLTDEGIADDLVHPVLAYAGTNGIFQPLLAAQPLSDVEIDNYPSQFFVDPNRVAPHSTFVNVASLAKLDSTHQPPNPLWSFRRAGQPFAASGAAPAAAVTVSFPAATATWSWDAAAARWLRTQDGAPDRDSTGAQLSAANVIIQDVGYITSAVVSGEGPAANGTPIPTGELVGSGTAWYLSGGRIAQGTWSRSSLTARTTYLDAAGRPVRLAPGTTWVELPQTGTTPAVTP